MIDENEEPIHDRAELDASHRDPANWKLGVLYFNKRDPRLLPPKRPPGLGWTINFANWRSVLLLIILAASTCAVFEGLRFLLNRGS